MICSFVKAEIFDFWAAIFCKFYFEISVLWYVLKEEMEKKKRMSSAFVVLWLQRFFSDKVSVLDFVCMGTFGQRVIQGAWGVFDMCNVQQCSTMFNNVQQCLMCAMFNKVQLVQCSTCAIFNNVQTCVMFNNVKQLSTMCNVQQCSTIINNV